MKQNNIGLRAISFPTHRLALPLPLLLVLASFCQIGLSDESKKDTRSPRPNILICIADDWSFGHAGVYDCRWVTTPGFDQVAKQGVLFQRAYTPNAKCAPSRASLLTGRNSWQLKAACNHTCFFPPEYKTFMEALREQGYRTGHTAKGWGPGRALDKAGKKRELTGPAFNEIKQKGKLPRGIHRIDYAANFETFFDSAKDNNQPWCFWYGALEPHRGYEYQAGARRAGKNIDWIQRVPKFWPDCETIRHDMLDYAFEVEHFDDHVARILEHLKSNQQLDNTIVVVTSDHGMPFPRCKGQAYEMSNHVPLAIMWPQGIKHSGRVIQDYVSLIDIAPTLVQAAQLDWASIGMAPTPGNSLMPILQSDRNGQVDSKRDHVVLGKERHDVGRPDDQGYPIRGIIKNDRLFLKNYRTQRWPAGDPVTGYLNCDGSPTKTEILNRRRTGQDPVHWTLCFGKRPAVELYDLSNDPDCIKNLATDKKLAATQLKLEQQLLEILTTQQDPRVIGDDPDVFEKYPYASPYHRNLFNKVATGKRVNAGWVNPSDYEEDNLDSLNDDTRQKHQP